jgi:hypothetical protein
VFLGGQRYIRVTMANDDLVQQIRLAVREEVKPLAKEVKLLKKEMRSLKETVGVAIGVFDRADNKLRKRVDRIEDHLNLPPLKN